MNISVDYIMHAEWLWKSGKWLPRKVAFAPVIAAQETLVIVPTKTTLGLFTVEDILKNLTLHPLNGFLDEPVKGRVFPVEMASFSSYLRGEFYHNVLKHPEEGLATIGTYDMATFIVFEPFLKARLEYLGPRINAEEEAIRKAQD